MRFRLIVAALCLALPYFLTLAQGGEPARRDKELAGRVRELVEQLGSDSFADREQARKDLETIGAPALAALRKATSRGDLETSRRAAELVRTIEERVQNAELLAAKQVHLKVKDVPVLQAVEQLAKQSGYAVRVDGDRTMLNGRTVTLDTGVVSFWEALDRLGEKTGLVEKLTLASLPADAVIANTTASFGPIAIGEPMLRPGKRRAPPPPPLRLMPLPAKAQPNPQPPPGKPPENPAELNLPSLPLPGVVILMPAAEKPLVSYAGAARVVLRGAKAAAKPPAAKSDEKYHDLLLDVSAEPRLFGFTANGVPTITRAVDEHGQALTFVIDPASDKAPPPMDPNLGAIRDWLDLGVPMDKPAPRGITVRLRPGQKQAKRLKELAGTVATQVMLPNTTLATLDLNAVNKSADIKGGGRLQLQQLTRLAAPGPGGTGFIVIYTLDGMPGVGAPPMVVTRGNRQVIMNQQPGTTPPELYDAKGNRYQLASGPSINNEADANGQVVKTTLTVQYQANAEFGEPTRLVLTGTHNATVPVPFRFVDVPLP